MPEQHQEREPQKTVLLTGASSGIGRACALRLAREGFRVFASVRKQADADGLRQEGGERIEPVLMDVTDAEAIEQTAQRLTERLGERGLDGLINNAGIGVAVPVEYVSMAALRESFEVNVFGQIAVTQAFLPLLRRARGRIVNMGSVGSHITIPFGGVLCGTKSAFRSLNDALRLELHPFGIHVSMVEPASINTPAVDKTLGTVEALIARLPKEGAARYGDLLRTFTQRATERERHGSTPDVVAEAVLHALTAATPHATYPVGKDSTRLVLLPRLLPDWVLDKVRFRLFGLPVEFGVRAATG